MTNQVRQLGSVFNYVAGVPTVVSAAPAKCTGPSLIAAQGKLIGRWTLPQDASLSTVVGFYRVVEQGAPVVFPTGASPDENLGRVSKWSLDEPPLGVLVDAWVVTRDKYGAPTQPTAANALYLGRNKITATRQLTIGGSSQA